MKRIAELRDLSDDHHTGLVLAIRCKRVTASTNQVDLESIWAQVAEAFVLHLEPHFRIEERHLLPALESIGEAGLSSRIRADHDELRQLHENAATSARVVLFGQRLEAHIRFEEREVFEKTQARLPVAALRDIEAACAAILRTRLPVQDHPVDNGMDADGVLEVLAALSERGVRVWLDGGWGVDALLGEQTRAHADLDLILSVVDGSELKQALLEIGFELNPGATDTNFLLVDPRGREVDAHLIEFDSRGYGSFELDDGRRWPFPPAAFAGKGRVGDRSVACLSADAQVQCHGQGYEPTENDLRDMERLQERFGVVLPLALCRQSGPE